MIVSENSKIIQVLDLVSTHLFCFAGGSDLVISSFAYMLIDMKSIKVCCLLFYMCSANLTVWPDLCLL